MVKPKPHLPYRQGYPGTLPTCCCKLLFLWWAAGKLPEFLWKVGYGKLLPSPGTATLLQTLKEQSKEAFHEFWGNGTKLVFQRIHRTMVLVAFNQLNLTDLETLGSFAQLTFLPLYPSSLLQWVLLCFLDLVLAQNILQQDNPSNNLIQDSLGHARH